MYCMNIQEMHQNEIYMYKCKFQNAPQSLYFTKRLLKGGKMRKKK